MRETVWVTSLIQEMQNHLCIQVPGTFWNLNSFFMASFITAPG